MSNSKKAMLIFIGFVAAVFIISGFVLSKTASWLIGLLGLFGVTIAVTAASATLAERTCRIFFLCCPMCAS